MVRKSVLDLSHLVVKKRKTIVNIGERSLLGRELNVLAGKKVIDIAMKGVNEKNGIAVIAAIEIEIEIVKGEIEITIVVKVMIVVIAETMIVIGIGTETDTVIAEAARDLVTNRITNMAKR